MASFAIPGENRRASSLNALMFGQPQSTLLASPWLAPMPPDIGARTFDVLKDVPPNEAAGPAEPRKFSKSAI